MIRVSIILAALSLAAACSSDTSIDQPPLTLADGTTPATDEQRSALLWEYIKPHVEWEQPPGFEGVVESAEPHLDFAGIYINEMGMTDLDAVPFGAVIVKRNLATEDNADVGAFTAMQKIEGYDGPGNWFWAKYEVDGTVSTTPDGVTLAGTPGGCIGCHGELAGGNDFLFIND